MMLADMPSISKSNYNTSTYSTAGFVGAAQGGAATPFLGGLQQTNALDRTTSFRYLPSQAQPAPQLQQQEKPMAVPPVPTRRLVQVFIADPDEAVPLDQSLLYTGEQKLTDLTDQELFFEIDIKSILASHNEKRTKIIDKSVKDRTEFLEPVKARDLKMVVVDVASF